jgi:hypothetical protein
MSFELFAEQIIHAKAQRRKARRRRWRGPLD